MGELRFIIFMKNIKYIVSKRIFILIFLLCSTMMFGVTVYTSPNPLPAELNIPFVVSINIDDIVNIRGYEVVIQYDVDFLEFDQADNGELFDGQPVDWWIVNEDTPGIIQVDCLIFGAGIYVTGPGNILDLTFTATSEGITSLEFIGTELFDPTGYVIPDVTSIDGCIIIGNQPPPPPQNLTIDIVGTTLSLSWDEASCCSYNVYSSLSLGNSEEWQLEAEDLKQNNWSCPIQESETSRFFYVTSEFDFSEGE